jgi:hypothetical protein
MFILLDRFCVFSIELLHVPLVSYRWHIGQVYADTWQDVIGWRDS